MTTVSFTTQGERIVGFHVEGHSGYAAAGSDIVCAAVTSAVRLTECAINDVLGLGATAKAKGDSVSLKLPGSLGSANESTCQALMTALMVYFAELHEEYPENITVVEEE